MVPDSVLICASKPGDKGLEGLYANSQIDSLFNTSVINVRSKKKVPDPYVKSALQDKYWTRFPL